MLQTVQQSLVKCQNGSKRVKKREKRLAISAFGLFVLLAELGVTSDRNVLFSVTRYDITSKKYNNILLVTI